MFSKLWPRPHRAHSEWDEPYSEDAPNRMERGGVGIGGVLGGNNRLRHELTSEFKHWEKSSPPARPHDICALKKEKKKTQTKTFFSLVTDYGFLQLFFKF